MGLKLIVDAAQLPAQVHDQPSHIGDTGLCAPISDAAAKFMEIRNSATSGSSTAKMIEEVLMMSKQLVGVLLVDAVVDSMHIGGHNLASHDTLSKFEGGVAVVNVTSILKIGGDDLPLGVSLFHELGHAKQSIEKPEWYKAKFDAAQTGDKQAKLDIENDNLASHETPICKELGLKFRTSYD